MKKVKEQLVLAKKLPDKAYLRYIWEVVDSYYERAYNRGIMDSKILDRVVMRRNKREEEEFFEELKNLQQCPYIADQALRMLNNIIPPEVKMVRNTLKLTLSDIADMSKEEVDKLCAGTDELRRIVYKLNY